MKFKSSPQEVDKYIFFIFLLFCLLSGIFLNNDFWQDEIYTLVHFVFHSWRTVIFDYHSTNNHILFNVILKFFSDFLGLNRKAIAFEFPILIRFIPYTFSILSLILFYKYTLESYGRGVAKIGLSIFCTTIVFIDFSIQVRGYSLSLLLIIIQYFTFLNVFKIESKFNLYLLFAITMLSLLCLPTNIYIAITYVFVSFFFFLFPTISEKYTGIELNKKKTILVLIVIAGSTIITLLYYKYLLQLQATNPLLNNFELFEIKNIFQLFAIFYHFSAYRFHFFLILIIWLILYLKKKPVFSKTSLFLPIALFSIPFFIFFVHGAIIVQRVFISLLPFYVLIIALAVNDVIKRLSLDRYVKLFHIFNSSSLVISFIVLIYTSKKNNSHSVHKHDLRNHYYLVNFNAREVTIAAKYFIAKENKQLLLWDDFGQTGILYYLDKYNVPYKWKIPIQQFSKGDMILTNNKKLLEKELKTKNNNYTKVYEDFNQYNLYIIN